MITRKSPPLADDLKMLFGAGVLGPLPDNELLTRFIQNEDVAEAQAAFSALVARHGPMVLGICERMLNVSRTGPSRCLESIATKIGRPRRRRCNPSVSHGPTGPTARPIPARS